MSFDAPRIVLAGIVKFELPDRDLRLCDGGFLYYDGEKYESSDPEFGAIGAVEDFEEKSGDEAPDAQLTFLPASTAAAGTLSQPDFQGSRVRFWFVRVDESTGEADDASAEQVADMLLDTTTLRLGRGTRELDIGLMAHAERLFSINEGNVLSTTFHQSIWPGEQGLDNAVDVGRTVAWGVAAPPRGSAYGGAAGLGGGGVYDRNPLQ